MESSNWLQRAAMQWAYVVRNRGRWVGLESTRGEQARRSWEQLQELGIDQGALSQLAEAEIIEVSIPYHEERQGWEARVFPWEYMLSAATRSLRQGRQLAIIRHLECFNRTAPTPTKKPDRLLIVESAPGSLRQEFKFDSERSLVISGLSLRSDDRSEDESRTRLRARIESYKPDVIHLSGFDTHQGVALGVLDVDEEPQDGYLLRGESGGVDPVLAEDLASILNAAGHKPALVSCNIYNSAARLCPLIVAGGAGATIGFRDEFDDSLAELFFTNFYHAWRVFEWDMLAAFKLAFKMLREQPQGLQGTGLVLWSARSLLTPQLQPSRRAARRPAPAFEDLERKMRSEKMETITLQQFQSAQAGTGDGGIGDLLRVEVKPFDTLNYSMLHNNRALFETFTLRKLKTGRVNRIQVKVMLYVGLESFQYTTAVDLIESAIDLKDRIRVPLIYSTGPTIRDSVHTSLFVEVTWENEVLHQDTYRVTLLPLDEWRDDDADRIWLPSFVQPRDPAVGKVVDAAQRYLMALLDYSGAGFDGYQSLDPQAEDPAGAIDLQVQAIWCALVYDIGLSYINPPPTYTSASQRIRTPSEVIDGRRGTCIDLALLLASCLEYIEVYPVIFLLEGHAFPGYWRSDQYHGDFQEMAGALPPDAARPGGGTTSQKLAWYLGKSFYDELLLQVRERRLMPIETVWLTTRGGFWEAIDEGMKNLRTKREFHSLLDVTQARRNGVTPIPMRGGQHGR
jgi:hypothetical protein